MQKYFLFVHVFSFQEVRIINLIKYSYIRCAKSIKIYGFFLRFPLICRFTGWENVCQCVMNTHKNNIHTSNERKKKNEIADEMARVYMWTNGFLFNSLNKFKRNEVYEPKTLYTSIVLMLRLIWIRQTNNCRSAWIMCMCVFDTLTDSYNFIEIHFILFERIISTVLNWDCQLTQLSPLLMIARTNLRLFFIIDNTIWTYFEPEWNSISSFFCSLTCWKCHYYTTKKKFIYIVLTEWK